MRSRIAQDAGGKTNYVIRGWKLKFPPPPVRAGDWVMKPLNWEGGAQGEAPAHLLQLAAPELCTF